MRAQAAHRLLLLLLLVSIVVRIVLVRGGGQYYWPDENYYEQAQEIVKALSAGHHDVVIDVLSRPGAVFFKVIAVLPAAFEYRFGENPHVPGLFFAMFSVCNIWLIGRIATDLGASELEALLASTLLALSSSFFYFARHLLPYDVSMTLALLAIDVGIRSGALVPGSFVCGLLSACALLTYNGYWTMASSAVLVHVTTWSRSWRDAALRLLTWGAGVCAVLGAVVAADLLLGGRLAREYPTFVSKVTQGSYQEGWRLPLEYLWHAEHGLLLVWIASLGLCLATWRTSLTSPRVRIGLIGVLAVFLVLAASSTLLHIFVVYGRLARQLVPFMCLITAYELARMWEARSRIVRALVPATIAILVVQSAVNFSQPLRQVFPDDLERRYGPSRTSPLIWVNVEHIYPLPRNVVLPDQYVLVYQAPHPLQFLPYQYEGYTPEQRRLLRSTDIPMRLIGPAPRD